MPTKKQLANLKVPSPSEARQYGKKGGIASGESRRRLKTFRELDTEHTTDDERQKMLDVLKTKAMHGDLRAFEVYRDTVGMKPKDTLEVSGELYNPYATLTDAELKKLAKDG